MKKIRINNFLVALFTIIIYCFVIYIVKQFISGGEGLILFLVPIIALPIIILIGVLKIILYNRKRLLNKTSQVLNFIAFIAIPLSIFLSMYVNFRYMPEFIILLAFISIIILVWEAFIFKGALEK